MDGDLSKVDPQATRLARPARLQGAPTPPDESAWAIRRPVSRHLRLPLTLALPLLLLVVWAAVTMSNPPVIGEIFLPSPVRVVQVTLRMILDGTLSHAVMASITRIGLAFLAAAVVAVPLGVLMGTFDPIDRLIDPITAALRYMPISAFIPLLILWFGIDEKQKIAFLFLGVFVYLLPVVVSAIRAVPQELVQTALTLGATRMQIIRTVLVPAALPEIFDSFRVLNAISWTYVILAEFVNARQGLGYLIQLAGNHMRTAEVFSGILVIGTIGLLTDKAIRIINDFLFPWREVQSDG
ncbi:MAG: ABC transporter permease [Polyangiaceae bacterium]|nr:ABC transporter permease [Polyangiaceae bacterium]